MKTLKEYLHESKQILWNNDPNIGWWLDSDPVTFYHGTHKDNLKSILKKGIDAPSSGPTKNWVSLAIEPFTAFGYASMSGGETSFRSAGSKAIHVPSEDRIVIVLKIPQKDFLPKMAEMRGQVKSYKEKLTNKDLYLNSGLSDSEYYAITEIRLPKHVNKKYIKGWMKK